MTRGADPARSELDARVLAWMREPEWRDDPARFEALALELFAFQWERCQPYRRFCERRGARPATITSWQEIPAVPTGAFKELELRSFPTERSAHVFRTSGTSSAARGALHLDTLALYEASLLPSFARHLLPDLAAGERAPILVLAPSPAEVPDSSLSHMFGVLLRERGTSESGFFLRGGALEVDALLAAIERASASTSALVLCGTAFAFVFLLDELARRGRSLALPRSARIMETGGFKGRSRELGQGELYAELEARLGVPAARIVNQYGMTELASQFHDSVLRLPAEPRRKLGPPWTRVALLDPVGGGPAPEQAVGQIVVIDLANTGSVLALQTADLGRRVADGFHVLGREPGAEARGCSIAADELLAGADA
ncbi:MAG TPA: long-chain fatty acid--CoA ligase [Myxococcota bacterium]